jgi:CMP-N,N'-diacetyllegionaminic acid synthase
MSRVEVLALIPARGGSKSVPRKNLLQIAGKPLIAYSIGHAQACSLVTRTIVSTDDPEIAQVARQFGAEVPFVRPTEFASDAATDLQVFRHALEWLGERGYRPDLVLHLRPTGPVRDVRLIEHAINLMSKHEEMWRIDGSYLRPALELPGFPEAHSMPRQRLPAVYWQNGYVDIVRPRTVLELDSMVGKVILPFVIEGKIHELDYPDQIPALELAVERWQRGELDELNDARHPA